MIFGYLINDKWFKGLQSWPVRKRGTQILKIFQKEHFKKSLSSVDQNGGSFQKGRGELNFRMTLKIENDKNGDSERQLTMNFLKNCYLLEHNIGNTTHPTTLW